MYHPVSADYDLYCVARGTMKAGSGGMVSAIAAQANQLKMGTGADDRPTVVVEFETGLVVLMLCSHDMLLFFFIVLF